VACHHGRPDVSGVKTVIVPVESRGGGLQTPIADPTTVEATVVLGKGYGEVQDRGSASAFCTVCLDSRHGVFTRSGENAHPPQASPLDKSQ